MADENDVEPTESDAGGTGDALAAFVNEEPEETIPRERAEPKREAKEPERRAKPETEDEPEEKAEGEDKKEPEKPAERRRIKVKDEEIDEEEVARGYLRGKDYTKKTQELAEQRKQVEEAKNLAKKDPAAALRLLGLSPDDYRKHVESKAFEFFSEEFAPDGKPLSEEQKAMRRQSAELAALKAKEAEREQAEKDRESAVTRAEQEKHWVKAIVTRLEATKEPRWLLPRIAGHLSDAIEREEGVDPADLIDDAIALAKEDTSAEVGHLIEGMEWASLKRSFPNLVEKVRKGVVADYKARGERKEPERIEPSEPRRRASTSGRRVMNTGDAISDFVNGR